MTRSTRGFTLLELMVTLAIVAVLTTLAYLGMERQRPRANLMSTTADLHALLRGARQNALSTGRDTVVLVFPDVPNPLGGTGRLVVIEDPTGALFETTAPNFESFDPTERVETGGADNLLGELLLPRGIALGLGGLAAPALPAPYSAIGSGACTFCSTGSDRRGAIVFDSRGRARFHDAAGAPLAVFGGTIALEALPEVPGYRMLVVSSAAGSVFALHNG